MLRKGIILFSCAAAIFLIFSPAFGSAKIEPQVEQISVTSIVQDSNADTSDESRFLQNLEEISADSPEEFEDIITYDVPVVVNDRVSFFINYFQTRGKKYFERWLSRSTRYLAMIKGALKENDMPEDLAYLALIESGFNPNAYSRARAVGMWQFIKGTGLKYGLKINTWVDERRDPEKATRAAAAYLKDLYAMFNSWELAAAGYNAGEGKITRAIDKHNTVDFWVMAKQRYLKRETKDYVPKFMAALLIAKEPEKYGFNDIEYEEPAAYEKVTVPGATDLRAVAKASNSSLEEIRELNPELLRFFTTPDVYEYEIRIPAPQGKEKFYENFALLPQQEKRNFLTHRVKKGDTIPKIAKVYGITVEPIIYLNDTRRIKPGMELVIPVMANTAVSNGNKSAGIAKKELRKLAAKGVKEVNYIVKKGDTISDIARRFGATVDAIKKWNDIENTAKIFPGDKIRIYPSVASLNLQEDSVPR